MNGKPMAEDFGTQARSPCELYEHKILGTCNTFIGCRRCKSGWRGHLLGKPVDESWTKGAGDCEQADLDLRVHGVEHLYLLGQCLDRTSLDIVRAMYHDQPVGVLVVPAGAQYFDVTQDCDVT